MHVANASAFLGSTRHAVVPGDTLLFDFVFFLHPVRCVRVWGVGGGGGVGGGRGGGAVGGGAVGGWPRHRLLQLLPASPAPSSAHRSGGLPDPAAPREQQRHPLKPCPPSPPSVPPPLYPSPAADRHWPLVGDALPAVQHPAA